MDEKRLLTMPSLLNDRRVADIEYLLHDVELDEPVEALSFILGAIEL